MPPVLGGAGECTCCSAPCAVLWVSSLGHACCAAHAVLQILQGRTDKRQMGSRAGNTFSVARFEVAQEDALMPEAGEREPAGFGLIPALA